MPDPFYLNLGAGDDIRPQEKGWINIDIRPLPGIDVVQNVCALSSFRNEVADYIVAQHVLEYIPRSRMVEALTEWKRVLKKEAELEIRVIDLEALTKGLYLNSTSKEMGLHHEMVISLLYGRQDTPHDVRFNGFTQEYLEGVLAGVGFEVKCVVKEDYDIIVTARKPKDK